MPGIDPLTPTPTKVIAELIGQNPTSIQLLARGRNNQVYRVECENGDRYLAKFYANRHSVLRDQMTCEFEGLNFLWENGSKCVPQPIITNYHFRCTIFDFIEGETIPASQVTIADIDQTVDFIGFLDSLHSQGVLADLATASDSCFSFKELQATIEQRFQKLVSTGSASNRLEVFLKKDFVQYYTAVSKRIEASVFQKGLSMDTILELPERVLSPSDFGFHNAIKQPNGQIVFLDFEYFGWDDPAKMISDYLIHPGQDLHHDLKQRFLYGCLEIFEIRPSVAARLDLVYQLCGFKWCLLLLNEFIPEYIDRRTYSQGDLFNIEETQKNQLTKAERLLSRIKCGDGPPY